MFNLTGKYADDADFTFAMSVYHIIRDIPDGRRKHKARSDVLNLLSDLKFDLLEELGSKQQGESGRHHEVDGCRGYESTPVEPCSQQGLHRQQGYTMQQTNQGQKPSSHKFVSHSWGQRQIQSNQSLGHPSQEWTNYPSRHWLLNQGQDDWGQGPTGSTARRVQTESNASQLQNPSDSVNVIGIQAQQNPVHMQSFQTVHNFESSSDTISDLLAYARKQDSDSEV